MRIMVTGSRGFLGGFVCKALEKQGHQITAVHTANCDLTTDGSLKQFDTEQFDQIFHLAVWTQAGDFPLYHSGEQWLINQKINTNMLDWWQKSQPQAKMICIGTSCAYDPHIPLVEENYLKGVPIDSLFAYAMTKRMLLSGLMALRKQYNLDYMYFIPSTLYGPDYHLDGRRMHFIFDLVRKIVRGKQTGAPVILWGDGHQERELIFVRDFVEVMLKINEKTSNEVVNIGGGRGFSIRKFAEMISEIVGYNAKQIEYDTTRYVGARSKVLSIEKLQSLVPGFSETSLHDGIAETVDWFSHQFALQMK